MADATLVLAWLVLAHLAADFLLQTESMVADKFTGGRRGWRGLLAHGVAVGACLLPFVSAFGLPGVGLLVAVTSSHVVIDRWKVRATRRAEGRALAAAHRRHEAAAATGLGPAWTPIPGALFIVDQLLHLGVSAVAWLVLIAATPVTTAFAGYVATLVRPREAVSGQRIPEEPAIATSTARSWRFRLGTVVATAEAVPAATAPRTPIVAPGASPAQLGATIGVLERLLIVTFVLTGSSAAVGFVVAAKTLARFKQLDDRDFAEYYLLGTLASVAVAVGSGLAAAAALGTLK
jgi:Protein of unknown function (DUF3307)